MVVEKIIEVIIFLPVWWSKNLRTLCNIWIILAVLCTGKPKS